MKTNPYLHLMISLMITLPTNIVRTCMHNIYATLHYCGQQLDLVLIQGGINAVIICCFYKFVICLGNLWKNWEMLKNKLGKCGKQLGKCW